MFQLTKVWVDPAPGIDTIEIRYTWSAHGESPRWDGDEDAEVMRPVPNTSPLVRTADLEIPRYVNGQDSYLVHYRFGPGGEHIEGWSPVITEAITALEVEYLDRSGDITEVRVLWSVEGSAAANWSQATLEGLPITQTQDPEQEGIADTAIYELVQTVPLPRRFVAKVWGPAGATVEYIYQLLRTNSPIADQDFEWWDDNGGRKFRITLSGNN
jgi:hypothetical protein